MRTGLTYSTDSTFCTLYHMVRIYLIIHRIYDTLLLLSIIFLTHTFKSIFQSALRGSKTKGASVTKNYERCLKIFWVKSLEKNRRQGHTLSAPLEKHCDQSLERIFSLEYKKLLGNENFTLWINDVKFIAWGFLS